jgi:pectin methylesterase-like acyl-CoA thioesterase
MLNKRKLALLLTAVLIISTGSLLVEWYMLSSPIVPIPAGAIVVPDNYPTIQSAIDNATAHSIIFVRRGQYLGIVIDKPLTLIGENQQNTIIQGYSHHYDSKNAVTITADYVSISGFNITGGRDALLIQGNYCEVKNNSITNNEVFWESNGVDLLGDNNILKRNYYCLLFHGNNLQRH